MKKILFLLLVVCSVCACTTPEEDAQIKLFWLEQMMQFMPKQARPGVLPPQPLPVFPPQEDPSGFVQEQPAGPKTQETAQPAAKTVVSTAKKPAATHRASSQFMEITLEDANRRVTKLKSNASLKDRQAMQRAIENVKQSNQQALRDIGTMFDGDTQAQAFAIVAKSEKILMRTANTSINYQNYLNAQRKILQEQDAQLNQLMRANAHKLRRVRG